MQQNATEYDISTKRLKQKQQLAIDLLLKGESDAAITRTLKMHRNTLWRWKQQNAFQMEYERQSAEAFTLTKKHMAQLLQSSIWSLRGVLESKWAERDIQVKAALGVLNLFAARGDVSPLLGEHASPAICSVAFEQSGSDLCAESEAQVKMLENQQKLQPAKQHSSFEETIEKDRQIIEQYLNSEVNHRLRMGIAPFDHPKFSAFREEPFVVNP